MHAYIPPSCPCPHLYIHIFSPCRHFTIAILPSLIVMHQTSYSMHHIYMVWRCPVEARFLFSLVGGVCGTALGHKPMVVHIGRMMERHTATNLEEVMRRAIAYVQGCSCEVVAMITDNAANFKAATANVGVVSLQCLAHAGQLLLQGVFNLWQSLLAKAESVTLFFQSWVPACGLP